MSKMNPIIHNYIHTTDSLASIIEKNYNKNQYLENIFLQLVKKEPQSEIDQKLLSLVDDALKTGHQDPNVFLLFLTAAIYYTCEYVELEKAKAFYSLASSFNFEEIHPIIIAIHKQHLSTLFRLEGNFIECDKLMNDSITLANPSDPRYISLLTNHLYKIAAKGELKENGDFNSKKLKVFHSDMEDLRLSRYKLINAIFLGDFHEARIFFEEYNSKFVKDLRPSNIKFADMINLLSNDFDSANYQDESSKQLANICMQLSTGNISEAMLSYQNMLKDINSKVYLKEYFSYLPLHFELALKHKGAAKLVLLEKKQKGDVSYMDDLFYGRLHLLENDIKNANDSFQRLTMNVKRFGAKNRLLFELQFAKEMPLPMIMRLLDGWPKLDRLIVPRHKINFEPKPVIEKMGANLLIGESAPINQIKELIKKYATLKAPILVTGETGTGKELVSRAIHDEGLNPKEPFIAINCGALTDTLLQSELFGYEAGAFTGAQKERQGIFEAAGSGTVLLDEFGDISPNLQVSLLRVLESNEIRRIGSTKTKKIECKIVIATNVNLRNAVVEKNFREDLFFRLSRFEIELPALRERKEDLPELIQYFIDLNNTNSETPKNISDELLKSLAIYHWPGNVRELKNEIDRLFILNPDRKLFEKQDFDFTHLQDNTLDNKEIKSDKNNTEILKPESKDDPYANIIQNAFHMDRRHQLLRELFQKYKKLTRKQIIEITKVGPSTISKDLQILIDSGFILRREPKSSPRTHYFEINSQIK